MLAAIWLLLTNEQEAALRALIEQMASVHGTVPFRPHFTVCSPSSEASWDAATEYIRHSKSLPMRLGKRRVSFSTTRPLMAVVIDLHNSPQLQSFRADLLRITDAGEPPPPHISLLYSIDETSRVPSWSSDESRLKGIAEECNNLINAGEFVLDRSVIVVANGDWARVRSWHVARHIL
jgi:hypothetical protein